MGHFSCVMVLPELFLRVSGNTPVSIDKFINDVNWLDIIGLHCLITLAGMLSNPEAFFYVYMVIPPFFSWSTQFVLLKYMWTIILTQTLNLTLCRFFENTIYVIGFLRQFDKYWKFSVVILMTLSRPTWILFMWLVDIRW